MRRSKTSSNLPPSFSYTSSIGTRRFRTITSSPLETVHRSTERSISRSLIAQGLPGSTAPSLFSARRGIPAPIALAATRRGTASRASDRGSARARRCGPAHSSVNPLRQQLLKLIPFLWGQVTEPTCWVDVCFLENTLHSLRPQVRHTTQQRVNAASVERV